MAANDFAIKRADFREAPLVRLPVGDVPGEANDLLRPGAGRLDDGTNVGERLANLFDEIRRKFAGFVPSDLTGEKQKPVLDHAVRIAARPLPPRRVDDFHDDPASLSRKT